LHDETVRTDACDLSPDGKACSAVFRRDGVGGKQGGPEIGAAFTALPFDHLIFTGGTKVGSAVMRAASETLTPVTLELGGKSPALIGKSADIGDAARRILTVKTFNAGQINVVEQRWKC
jgi:acyl-CoA reductase-like NAD-dependent aldehyde dehydrogenase